MFLEQTLILCLDTKQGFSCLPTADIGSTNVTHQWVHHTVEQPKKQWERTTSLYTILQERIQGRVCLLATVKGENQKLLGNSDWTHWDDFSALHFLCRELLDKFPAKSFFSPLSGKCQFMEINKLHGNMLFFQIKYFLCAEKQKANGDDKVKECSDISFQACQL